MKKITVSPLYVWTEDLQELIDKEKEKIPNLEMKTIISTEEVPETTEKYGIDNIVKSILLFRIMIDLVYGIVGIVSIKKLISIYRQNGKISLAMVGTLLGAVFSIREIINNFSALKDAMFTLWEIKKHIKNEILDLSGLEWERLKPEIANIFGGGYE
jgi:hypothetical protein